MLSLFIGMAFAESLKELRPVNPRTWSTPSGVFTFRVNPSASRGEGPANYELRRMGKLQWSRRLPFMLSQGGVDDLGRAAGVGSAGIVFLTSSGGIRTRHNIPGGPFSWSPGVVFDAANDRLVVRTLADRFADEEWWVYSISRATLSKKLVPANYMPSLERLDTINACLYREPRSPW